MKLLYAEDEAAMAEAVTDILTYHHYLVDAVSDGEEALAYARAEAYDGIILGIMMPKLDGLAVLDILRGPVGGPAQNGVPSHGDPHAQSGALPVLRGSAGEGLGL